jgi:hypothetical protein
MQIKVADGLSHAKDLGQNGNKPSGRHLSLMVDNGDHPYESQYAGSSLRRRVLPIW